MSDERRGPMVVGALTVFTGAVLFLTAGDVIPLPDKTFGGPRWLVALLALGIFFGGFWAIAVGLPTPRMRGLLGGAAGLAAISFAALMMTWLALTGGGRQAPARPPRGTLVLGPDVAGILVHAFFWLFAIPLDVIALVAWFFALRALLRRRPS
ncbi:MAG TPA: hypothetical protein VJZ73_18615 [Methylomirabilota bacterium]|nr:hypothetical protein [Methylomirabilota bacterium]